MHHHCLSAGFHAYPFPDLCQKAQNIIFFRKIWNTVVIGFITLHAADQHIHRHYLYTDRKSIVQQRNLLVVVALGRCSSLCHIQRLVFCGVLNVVERVL